MLLIKKINKCLFLKKLEINLNGNLIKFENIRTLNLV